MGLAAAVLVGAATISARATPTSGAAPLPYPLAMSSAARIGLWKAALKAWRDHPLLGAGAAAYYPSSAKYQGSKRSLFAHDLPLELAAELGVLGLLLGLALYAATAGLLMHARSTPELWLLGPPAAAFLIANLVDWPWHLAGPGAAWAVAAGGLAAASPRSPARPSGRG